MINIIDGKPRRTMVIDQTGNEYVGYVKMQESPQGDEAFIYASYRKHDSGFRGVWRIATVKNPVSVNYNPTLVEFGIIEGLLARLFGTGREVTDYSDGDVCHKSLVYEWRGQTYLMDRWVEAVVRDVDEP